MHWGYSFEHWSLLAALVAVVAYAQAHKCSIVFYDLNANSTLKNLSFSTADAGFKAEISFKCDQSSKLPLALLSLNNYKLMDFNLALPSSRFEKCLCRFAAIWEAARKIFTNPSKVLSQVRMYLEA